MEAGNPKRAAVRLAAMVGGAVLTVVLLATTAYVARKPAAKATPDTQVAWDLIETGQSYQLPQAADPLTPVGAAGPSLSYAAPTYEAPIDPTPASPRVAERQPPVGPSSTPPTQPDAAGWAGPVTIHNPAAFGPPEDDSLPPIPTAAAPALVASRPTGTPTSPPIAGPTFSPQAMRPPAAWTPTPPLTEAPGVVSGPSVEEFEERLEAPTERAYTATPVRPLRDLAPSSDQALLSYTASTNDLSKRLAKDVQAGFQLGKAGAVYAARGKFVGVLRRIALAKDAEGGSNRHATALAEGLRTLDDADDFVPRGNALEAELDVAAIASSHGLRLLGGVNSPHEATARYSQHAAAKLAEAAAGEPAGSMALYGLGKTYTRLETQGDDPTAGRKGTVMFRAAVDANADNYLAANELGVRLARAGRYQQASQVLRQAATRPDAIATVHANLAAVEQKLGNDQTARLAQQHSENLAQAERATGQVSRRHGVEWVAPDQFQRVAPRPAAVAQRPTAPPAPGYAAPRPAPSGWSGFVAKAKRATGWSSAEPSTVAPPTGAPQPPMMATQPRVVR